MKIRYTKHAGKKLNDLRVFGVVITKAKIAGVIEKPAFRSSDNGNAIAAASFDTTHNLRVVYKR